MSLIVTGLYFDIIGVLILTITSILNPMCWRKDNLKFWQKRYSWLRWKPYYTNTKTLKLVISWKHKKLVYGRIPPKHRLNIFGLLLMLTGFILQIIGQS